MGGNDTPAAPVERRVLKIFVSSPGDVGEERVIAERVIGRLKSEFAEHLLLQPQTAEAFEFAKTLKK